MQVWLAATTKANTQEAGANVQESGLFADAGPLEDREFMSQNLSPGRWGTHVSKPISTSHWRQRFFYKEGEGNRTKRSREGVAKFSMCRQAQSIPVRQVMVRCASSWIHIILVLPLPDSMGERQQIFRS